MPITPILSLDLPVRVTGGFPRQVIDVRITPRYGGDFDPNFWDPTFVDVGWSYGEQPQIEIDLDASLASSALPRESRRQILPPWRVQVGSSTIPWYRHIPGLTITESIEGISSFSFSLPRRGTVADPFIEPLGSPRSWLGIPGGKKSINITAEFLTENGSRRSVPLIRDGVFDNTSSRMGDDGDVRTWNGGGAHARIDRVPITYQAPPGHGQTSGTVVRRLLTLAGVPPSKIAIGGGRRMYKPISLIDAHAIASANEILLPESKRIYHDDRSDTWKLLDYSGVTGKRIDSVITEDDVLKAIGSLGDAAASDAPTRVVLTSTAQVTRDDCGVRLKYRVQDTFEVRGVFGVRFTQNADGTLNPTSWGGESAKLRKTRRQVTVEEYDCETLISTEVSVWGWFAPESYRYEQDASGALSGYRETATEGGYIFNSGATKDDDAIMYEWESERFAPISWQRDEHTYDDRGYLVSTVIRRGGWRLHEAPMKTRSVGSDSWELEPYDVVKTTSKGQPIDSGEGWYGSMNMYNETSKQVIQLGGSPLMYGTPQNLIGRGSVGLSTGIEREEITYTVEGGFITQESKDIYRWFVTPGSGNFLYFDDVESSNALPDFVRVERHTTSYSAAGESKHHRFVSKFDHNGKLIDSRPDTNLDGYLPVAEQRVDIVPPASSYDDPSEASFATAASRSENRPLKVEVVAPALEAVRIPWTQKGVNVQYAENEDDMVAVGIQIIRELSSIDVQFPLSFNPLIRPAQRHILHLPSIGVHNDLLIETVQHRYDESQIWTQVSGRQDVV